MSRPDRMAGFTLLEVIVALAIGSAVMLTARLVVSGVASAASGAADSRARDERLAVPTRTLQGLLRRVEAGTDTGRTFIGNDRAARFTSWCDHPGGWQERCVVYLWLDPNRGSPSLRLRTSLGADVVVRAPIGSGALFYLLDARAGGTWLPIWGARLTAPAALLLILDRDSLVLRVGERG